MNYLKASNRLWNRNLGENFKVYFVFVQIKFLSVFTIKVKWSRTLILFAAIEESLRQHCSVHKYKYGHYNRANSAKLCLI